jgi:GNAT superfamily N-acetyltransferase
MWWRVKGSEFQRLAGDRLKDRLRRLTDAHPPGLLAYRGGHAVGWISVGPRPEFGRLNRSPKLKPIDDRAVWSVVCFYIHRNQRRSGVASALLAAAIEYARSEGAEVLEGYPIDTSTGTRSNADLYSGTCELFDAAGFAEVARRAGRPILRRELR